MKSVPGVYGLGGANTWAPARLALLLSLELFLKRLKHLRFSLAMNGTSENGRGKAAIDTKEIGSKTDRWYC